MLYCSTTFSINYLTKKQMSQIKTILRHPNKSDYMVDKISQILYQHYKYKAFDMAYDFKQFHYKQCKNIDFAELKLYASRGLLMAIKNYNPEYPFINHMKIYVKGQLHVGLTDLYPLTILPKTVRISKKWKKENRKTYIKLLNTNFVGNNQYLYEKNMDCYKLQSREYSIFIKVWDIINNIDIEYQRIMKYKYNFFMETIRSNSEVAELMCCSHECVRKKILYVKDEIRRKLYPYTIELHQ